MPRDPLLALILGVCIAVFATIAIAGEVAHAIIRGGRNAYLDRDRTRRL